MFTLINWLLKSKWRFPFASQKKTPLAFAMVRGATLDWADHSKIVCRLQSWTISSAERELASNIVSPRCGLRLRKTKEITGSAPQAAVALALWMFRRVELAGERLANIAVETNLAGGDLAQRKNGRLVLGGIDDRSRTRHQLPGPLRCEEYEGKPVVHQREAIFDGNAGHEAPCAVRQSGDEGTRTGPRNSYEFKWVKSSSRAADVGVRPSGRQSTKRGGGPPIKICAIFNKHLN